jgi:hypothetical protein
MDAAAEGRRVATHLEKKMVSHSKYSIDRSGSPRDAPVPWKGMR